MCWGINVSRCLFWVTNTLCAMCALVGGGLSIGLHIMTTDTMKVTYGELAFRDTYVIVPVCFLVFLTSFLGCCAVTHRARPAFYAFATLMLFACVTLLAFTLATYFGTYSELIKAQVGRTIESSFELMYNDSAIEESFNALQRYILCCGVSSKHDYEYVHQRPLPGSCCNTRDECTLDKAFKDGCRETFMQTYDEKSTISFILLLIFCCLMFMVSIEGYLFACVRPYRRYRF